MRHRSRIVALTLALSLCACASPPANSPTPAPAPATATAGTAGSPMRWPDLLDRPRPTGGTTIAYGGDPLQVGDLWLPATPARLPVPVVLMVHGGCWQTDIADRSIMDWIAADLAAQGIAVWNIDYRGVDRPGGGYPGTFADVAAAVDHLRAIGPAHGLATDRIVALGHSAGGHLALWAAARARLPQGSVLAGGDPPPIAAVVATGALPDIEAALALDNNGCTQSAMPALTGTAAPGRADVFADTSIPRLLPLHVRQIFVSGAQDRIAPPSLAEGYAARATAAGETVERVTVAREGHVELIAPGSQAWAQTVRLIRRELGLAEQ